MIYFKSVNEESTGRDGVTHKHHDKLFIGISLGNERDIEIYLKYIESSFFVTVPKFIQFY